ncbi:MAG: hypothetical protein A3F70_14940 [Acidobacteria bacterium RIFCSPLOWO2_12_FULL_67_14]|nr:MAG: hypothetical protein A3H29_12225 [Acidobacteria bacterium RIFCSPLOWO2_02_FULL_67_21]OFW35793.1 MAG: hypothetical protein A3F70_14940 [Acidobacteria bacterium RIFCSPLOWO2_12_FULL_67_14]
MRRLIVCCDGTWKAAESVTVTNITYMARAIAPIAAGGIPQVVLHDPGVGTGNFVDRISGGAIATCAMSSASIWRTRKRPNAAHASARLHESRTGMYRLTPAHVRPIGRDSSGREAVWHTAAGRAADAAANYAPANLVEYLANPGHVVAGPDAIFVGTL